MTNNKVYIIKIISDCGKFTISITDQEMYTMKQYGIKSKDINKTIELMKRKFRYNEKTN